MIKVKCCRNCDINYIPLIDCKYKTTPKMLGKAECGKWKFIRKSYRVSAINSLIPTAKINADKRFKESGLPGYQLRPGLDSWKDYRHYYLIEFYHSEMNKMANELGLRVL